MFFFSKFWQGVMKLSFASVAAITIFLLSISAGVFFIIEPETFPTYFEAFWYTMTTATTVGYGDYFPTTTLGRSFGMLFYIYGILLLTIFIGKIQTSVMQYKKLREEGKMAYTKNGHYIYIDWTKRTKDAIDEVLASEPECHIVLIDELVEKTPYEHSQVHFIAGDPSEEDTLLKANILHAKRIAIFSDCSIDSPTLADGKSLLIATTVESLSEQHTINLHTIVEIMKESNIAKFKHVKVDDFILSNESISRLMAKATLHPMSSSIFNQLLGKRYGENLYEIRKKPHWKSYRDAAIDLFDQGATLIAVGDNMDVAQRPNDLLTDEDVLYIVTDENGIRKFR
ncbi:ion channel [Bacillus sp. DJP31]|uniref:potassium channel protein n=1 Tax=Bacillus sp. DJP31 TaxID=3409789 RepID=UPI003BB5ED8A